MSPALSRALRAMSTSLLVVATLVAGGTLALLTHARERARHPAPRVCTRVIDEAYGIDGSAIPDSVLLARLLRHRARCIGDAAYVDQARRLMLNLQRTRAAHALLEDAERAHAFAPDELAAQAAWVDVEVSRIAEATGDSVAARAARGRATATVERLRERWPEWPLPYTIMREMQRTALADSAEAMPLAERADALEREAQHQIANGAIVRSLTEPQALVVAFLTGVFGVLGLATIVSALASIREMQRMHTSTIAGATPGYVELTGTLHLPARAEAVIGPLSKRAGVWYAVETNLGMKGAQTFRERSAQAFLLRDATGDVAIDPNGLTVRTRHSVTKFGTSGGVTSSRRTTERMLCVGDAAYVLGELAVVPAAGTTARRVRLPEDGRRLIVSNYSEGQLIRRELVWLALGCTLVVLAVAGLFWGYAQRFQVQVIPGVLG